MVVLSGGNAMGMSRMPWLMLGTRRESEEERVSLENCRWGWDGAGPRRTEGEEGSWPSPSAME